MNKSSSLSTPDPLRRKPQQKRGQQRVEKILLAAAEVFAEAGFAAATIQQIADRASTAVGSIYQFFPDKLTIFRTLLTAHLEHIEILEAAFFASDPNRPLRQVISEYIDSYASYLEEPISRCVILQDYLQPIGGLSSLMGDPQYWIDRLMVSIKKHAELYRQRNSNLDETKSELLSEVAHYTCNSLFQSALKSEEPRRQQLYNEMKDVLYGYLNPHIGDHLLVLPSKMMICPNCQSDRIAKNGHHQGKQRHICRECGRQFMGDYIDRGYPSETRQQCLDLHQQGLSFREIERQTGVNHNTVINWVKKVEINGVPNETYDRPQ
jgi:AcrR family transcriptional regulator/transposase-like protein